MTVVAGRPAADVFDVEVLTRGPIASPAAPFTIAVADDAPQLRAAHDLRHAVFVREQGLFVRPDRDEHDDDPRTRTLVARDQAGTVLGTVRLSPARPHATTGSVSVQRWSAPRAPTSRPSVRCGSTPWSRSRTPDSSTGWAGDAGPNPSSTCTVTRTWP